MKYGILFGLMSLLLIVAGLEHPWLELPLWWLALSFAIVALSYLMGRPQIFGKRPDGTQSWISKSILLPYLLYTAGVWHLMRLLSREPAIQQIDEDLFIGRRLLGTELSREFDHYVDLTSEFQEPRPIRERSGYLSLPVLDADTPRFETLDRFVRSTSDGCTYIHCAQGHGRTGLFAIVWLIRHGKAASAAEALAMLQAIRPGVSLNAKQNRFLETYLARPAEIE